MIAFWRKQGRLRNDGETGTGSWNPSRTEADGEAWGEQVGQKASGTKPRGRQGQDPVAGQQPPMALALAGGGADLKSSLPPGHRSWVPSPPHLTGCLLASHTLSPLPNPLPRGGLPFLRAQTPLSPAVLLAHGFTVCPPQRGCGSLRERTQSPCSLEHPQLRRGSGNSTEVCVGRGEGDE